MAALRKKLFDRAGALTQHGRAQLTGDYLELWRWSADRLEAEPLEFHRRGLRYRPFGLELDHLATNT